MGEKGNDAVGVAPGLLVGGGGGGGGGAGGGGGEGGGGGDGGLGGAGGDGGGGAIGGAGGAGNPGNAGNAGQPGGAGNPGGGGLPGGSGQPGDGGIVSVISGPRVPDPTGANLLASSGPGMGAPPLTQPELARLKELLMWRYGDLQADVIWKEIMAMDTTAQRHYLVQFQQEYNSKG